MRLETDNTKSRTELTFFVLTAIAVLSGALAFAKGASFFRGSARVKQITAQVGVEAAPEPNDLQPHLDQAKETAEALKKNNLFVKEPPRKHPIDQIDGILGNEVLVGDRWYKVGGKVGDAEILAIEATEVRVRWDGKEKSFGPLAGKDRPTSPPKQEKRKEPQPPREEAAKVESKPRAAPAEVKVVTVSATEDPLAWMGVELPPDVKEKLLDYWNKMSDEEKEKAEQEWNNMSDQEKEEAIEALGRNM